MELVELLEEYLVDIEVKGFTEQTRRSYKFKLALFNRLIEVKNVEDLRTIHIKKFIQQRQKEVSRSTINLDLKLAKGMFKYAVEEGIINENPFDRIKPLKQEKRVMKTYTKEDIQKVLNIYNGKSFLDIRNKTILMTFIGTGIRSSELRYIQMDDVFDDHIRIFGKGQKERVVSIPPELRKQLKRYERARKSYMDSEECSAYFVTRAKRPIKLNGLRALVIEISKVTSVDATFHSFRRYYAQEMLKHTDLYTVSRILGHSNVGITQIYVQGTEDQEIIRRGMNSPLSNL